MLVKVLHSDRLKCFKGTLMLVIVLHSDRLKCFKGTIMLVTVLHSDWLNCFKGTICAHERIVLYFKHFGGFELENVYTFM